jgi:acetyltransferase-like isoleucine patch superfamily enzyme
MEMANIHPTSLVDSDAILGSGIEIGPYSIVHSNVVIGNRTKIGAYCEIGLKTHLGDGSPLVIGEDSLIRSHSIFYESSSLGYGLTTGHRVTVRENTIAGDCFQIGTLSEIQGDCQIGDHVRFQSSVFVGKKTRIGNFVWVLPYAVLTNDPTPPSNDLLGCTIQDYAVISAMAVILPGVAVGKGAIVAAHACVTKDVPQNMLAAGVPARIIAEAQSIKRRDGSDRPAYPWTEHFHRGYPDEIVNMWTSKSALTD